MKPPPTLRKYRDDSRGDKADDEDLVKYRGLRGLLSRLLFFVPAAAPGGGIEVRMTQNGPEWYLPASTASPPLTVRPNGTVVPGTIAGLSPKIGTDSIATLPAPALTIPASGTAHVVVNVESTLAIEAGVYVAGFTSFDAITLTVETTDPSSAGLKSNDGLFYFVLATFVDGVKTAQNYTGSLLLSVCDDGTAAGTADLVIEST